MNLVEATLERRDGELVVRFADALLRVPAEVAAARPALARYEGGTVALGIRPEDIEDASVAGDRSADERFGATVDIREDMGSEVFLHFSVPAAPIKSGGVEAALEHESLEALKAQAAERGTPFVARADRSSRASERQRVELAVDTARLHFFDLETGEGIYRDAEAEQPVARLEAVAD